MTDFNFNITVTELSGKENILKQFDNVNYKIAHFINHPPCDYAYAFMVFEVIYQTQLKKAVFNLTKY